MGSISIRLLALAGVALVLCGGCTVAGPSAINSGRLTYNESIARTNEQQMLMALVRARYGHDNSLLTVASVTANVRVKAGASFELGFGDRDNYAGNLVPLSGNATYEDNPTVSYVPVKGERYLHQITAPVSVAVLARLATSLVDPAPLYSALVSSVNGIYNPDFLFTDDPPDPRFGRLVAILSELSRMQRLHWVEDVAHSERFSIVIDRYVPEYLDEVNELLELVGVPHPAAEPQPVVLPVSLAIDGSSSGGIGIITRSVMRLIEILAASIELPADDVQAGVTLEYPPLGPVGQRLKVRNGPQKPKAAAVAVAYRDGWFYIDNGDLPTKTFFRLLTSMWSVSIAESTHGASAPVLTVPVSR